MARDTFDGYEYPEIVITHGQAVSDWALVRFGRKFSENKFRDGSWAERPGFFERLWRSLWGS